jgi:hypothetical protein
MKKLITVMVFGLLAMLSFAQQDIKQQKPNAKREEKIRSIYIAFMTQQLNLTSDDAQKFWPVHAQYEKEIRDLGMGFGELDREEKLLAVKKKYEPSFSKILGAERTNTFYAKDAEFKRRLLEKLQQLRQRRQQGMGKDNKPPKNVE